MNSEGLEGPAEPTPPGTYIKMLPCHVLGFLVFLTRALTLAQQTFSAEHSMSLEL